MLLFGLFINCLWVAEIESSRKLNSAKFKVIHKLEDRLLFRCFKEEENFYKTDKRKDFSTIEKCVPYLTSVFYLTLILFQVNEDYDLVSQICRWFEMQSSEG